MPAATTIAFITDPQFATDRPEDPWYSRRIVRWLNNAQQSTWPPGTSCAGEPIGEIAGVFVAGDLSQQGSYRPPIGDSDIFLEFRHIYEQELSLPVYMGLGNHDCETCKDVWNLVPDWYRNYMWGYINQMHYGTTFKPPIRPVTSIDAWSFLNLGPPSWKKYSFNYSVEYEYMAVIQLHRYGCDDFYGRAPGNDWLQGELERIRKSSPSKPIVICQHMGWTDLCDPAIVTDPVCGEQSFPKNAADALLDRLADYNVIAVLRGHDHEEYGQLPVQYTDGRLVGFMEYIPGSGCSNIGWGTNPDKVDAAVFLPPWDNIQRLCFFRGPQVLSYGGNTPWDRDKFNSFDQGPVRILDVFKFIPSKYGGGIDAATLCSRGQAGQQRIYLFRDTEYIGLGSAGEVLERQAIATGWRGLPAEFQSGLGSVLTLDWLPVPYAYFVKGGRCARWNLKEDRFQDVIDLKAAFPGLPDSFADGFDTAVATPHGQPLGSRAAGIYFFRQGTYCHLSEGKCLPCDGQGTDPAACDMRTGWPGVFVKRDGGFAGLMRVSPDTCDIAMGWVNFDYQMEWDNAYAVYNLDKPLPDTSILQLRDENGVTRGTRYSRAGVGGYRMTWDHSLNVTSSATGWLPVTHDDQTDILQFRDKKGQLTMYTYVPDGSGGYTAGWAGHDLGAPAAATAWLPVERDDRIDVVQIWSPNNSDTLAMRTFTRADDGSYTVSSPTTYAHSFATALNWSVCRINDQTAGIVQAWDNGEYGVAITLFTPDGKGGFTRGGTTNTGLSSDALGWVSAYSEGRTYLVQFRRRAEGEVNATVYSPDPAADRVTWFDRPVVTVSHALAWLAVDTQGEGNQDIIQVTDDGSGHIALVVWAGPYDDDFPHSFPRWTMPQPSAGSIRWLTCTSADRKSNIAGLWDNNGDLGIAVYSPSGERGAMEWSQDTATPYLGQNADALGFFAVDDRT